MQLDLAAMKNVLTVIPMPYTSMAFARSLSSAIEMYELARSAPIYQEEAGGLDVNFRNDVEAHAKAIRPRLFDFENILTVDMFSGVEDGILYGTSATRAMSALASARGAQVVLVEYAELTEAISLIGSDLLKTAETIAVLVEKLRRRCAMCGYPLGRIVRERDERKLADDNYLKARICHAKSGYVRWKDVDPQFEVVK